LDTVLEYGQRLRVVFPVLSQHLHRCHTQASLPARSRRVCWRARLRSGRRSSGASSTSRSRAAPTTGATSPATTRCGKARPPTGAATGRNPRCGKWPTEPVRRQRRRRERSRHGTQKPDLEGRSDGLGAWNVGTEALWANIGSYFLPPMCLEGGAGAADGSRWQEMAWIRIFGCCPRATSHANYAAALRYGHMVCPTDLFRSPRVPIPVPSACLCRSEGNNPPTQITQVGCNRFVC
jgi:hypothetical protein